VLWPRSGRNREWSGAAEAGDSVLKRPPRDLIDEERESTSVKN